MTRLASALIAILLLVPVYACDEDNSKTYLPLSPSPTSTSTTNSPTRIEYRVTGTPLSARIRYSNAVDGLTQVVTGLPYVTGVTTNESSMFISLEATPVTGGIGVIYPFMSIQIFVNGVLFREASSSDLFLTTVSISGSWRR